MMASMKPRASSRRNFLASCVAAAVPAAAARPTQTSSNDARAAHTFIDKWDKAWKAHDPRAMAALHTDDAVTVNRFGTVVQGRAAIENALAFLHGPKGPFHRSTFPQQQLLVHRMIAPGTMVIQTKWQNPVLKADGTIDPLSVNDMIVTFVLVESASDWLAAEVNLVNVATMDLPFSNPGQKP